MVLDIVTVQKILHHFLGPSERATNLRRMGGFQSPLAEDAEMFVEQTQSSNIQFR